VAPWEVRYILCPCIFTPERQPKLPLSRIAGEGGAPRSGEGEGAPAASTLPVTAGKPPSPHPNATPRNPLAPLTGEGGEVDPGRKQHQDLSFRNTLTF
jgi:hypothetical protein